MLRLATCIAVFVIVGKTEAKLSDSRSVNVALETVLAFNNRDSERNIKFIDEFQTFLTKVKETVANNGRRTVETKVAKRRNFGRVNDLKFTDFIKELIAILKDYKDEDLEDVFAVIDDEIRKYHYKGCKFYELISNQNVRRYVADVLDLVKQQPGATLKKSLTRTLKAIEDAKYDSKQSEMLDYIDSLYTKRDDEMFHSVLDNFDMYKIKSKRANIDIIKLVRDSIRNVLFDHYSNLNKVIRQDLKNNIEDFMTNNMYDPDEAETLEPNKEPMITIKDTFQILRDTIATTTKPISSSNIPDTDKNNVINFDFNFDNRFKIKDKEIEKPTIQIPVKVEIGRKDSMSTEGNMKIKKYTKNDPETSGDQNSSALKDIHKIKSGSFEGNYPIFEIQDTADETNTEDYLTTEAKNQNKLKESAKLSKKKQKLRDRTKYTDAILDKTTKKSKHIKKQVQKETWWSSHVSDESSREILVTEMADDLKLAVKTKNKNFHYAPSSKRNKPKNIIKKQERTPQSTEFEMNEKILSKKSPTKDITASTNRVNIFESLQNVIKKISSKIDEKNNGSGNEANLKKNNKKKKKQIESANDDDTFVTYEPKKSTKKSKHKHFGGERGRKKHKKSNKNKHQDLSSSSREIKSETSNDSLGNKVKKTHHKPKKVKKSKRIKIKRRKQKETMTSKEESSESLTEETDKPNVENKIKAVYNYLNKYTTPNRKKATNGFEPTRLASIKNIHSRHRPPMYLSRSDENVDNLPESQEELQTEQQNLHPPKKYNSMDIPIKAYMADSLRRQESKRMLDKITPTKRNAYGKYSRRQNDRDNFRMRTNAITFIPLEDFQNKGFQEFQRKKVDWQNSDMDKPKDLLEEKYNMKSKEYFMKDANYGVNNNQMTPEFAQKIKTMIEYTQAGINAYMPVKTSNKQTTTPNMITTNSLPITQEIILKDKIKNEKIFLRASTTPDVKTHAEGSTKSNGLQIDLDTFVKNINISVAATTSTEIPIITTLANLNKSINKSINTNVQEKQDKNKTNSNKDFIVKTNITLNDKNFEKFMGYEGEFTTEKRNTTTLSEVVQDLVPEFKDRDEILDAYDRNILSAYKEGNMENNPLLQPINVIGGTLNLEDRSKIPLDQDRAYIMMGNGTTKQA